MSNIKRKTAAGTLTLPCIQANQVKEMLVSSATEGRTRESRTEPSLSSAVYSVQLQSKSKASIYHKQPCKYVCSTTNNRGGKRSY